MRQRQDVQRLTEAVAEVTERRGVVEPTVEQTTRDELGSSPRLEVDATDGMHVATRQRHRQQRLARRAGIRAAGVTEGLARDVVGHVRREVRERRGGRRDPTAPTGHQRQNGVEGEPPIGRGRIERARQPAAVGHQFLLDPAEGGLGHRGRRRGRGDRTEREQRERHDGKRRKTTDRAHLHDSSHELGQRGRR